MIILILFAILIIIIVLSTCYLTSYKDEIWYTVRFKDKRDKNENSIKSNTTNNK